MYTKSISMQDNEIPAVVNQDTGEVKVLGVKPNNIPVDKELFGKEQTEWKKSFTPSWKFLDEVLTDLEIRVVMKMCIMAEMNTNSLKPLNDSTTQLTIATMFNIDRRKAKIMFEKFYKLGIYGRFDVYDESQPFTKYWILNPYLSFGGKIIASPIVELFSVSKLTKEYFRRLSE
jgi:hypothetical protein